MSQFKFPEWSIVSARGMLQEGTPITDAEIQNGARIVKTYRKSSAEAIAAKYRFSMVYRIVDGERATDEFILPYPNANNDSIGAGSWKDSDWVDQWQSRGVSGLVTPTESNDSTKMTFDEVERAVKAGLMTEKAAKAWVKANS